MTTVYRWTGRETTLLRVALRLSVRGFAEHLGIGARTINTWEARQGDLTPVPQMQEILDTALARASHDAQARFSAATRTHAPTRDTTPRVQPAAPPLHDARLPVVINGPLLLVPIDADTATTNDLSALVEQLIEATTHDQSTQPSPGENIEPDDQPQRDIVVIDHAAPGFGTPQLLLGSGSSAATVESTGVSDIRKVDKMLRRDFSGAITALTLGAGIDALDIERLAALVNPHPVKSTPKKIGTADVEAIEQVTAALRRLHFSSGGGVSHSLAVTQLQAVLPLLNTASTPAVQERLIVATADLGLVAAWANHDIERDDDARRLWPVALSVARRTNTARATDLTVQLLLGMTLQALHLRRPREALGFVQLGHGIVASRSQPLSAATASNLAGIQALCHGTEGDAGACDRAIGQAIDHFTGSDPAEAEPWVAHVNAAELASREGSARFRLALATDDTTHAARAIPLIQQAVHDYGPAYVLPRAINLARLAGARTLTGDLDAAVHTGHQAVEEITALTSPRAYEQLRTLDTVLKPHATDPAVSEVRHQISEALTAA